jgi:hypothetical protein
VNAITVPLPILQCLFCLFWPLHASLAFLQALPSVYASPPELFAVLC